MDDELISSIKDNFKDKTSEELQEIISKNNVDEWSDEAFEAARLILKERNLEIPTSKEIYENVFFNIPCYCSIGEKPRDFAKRTYSGCMAFSEARLMFLSKEDDHGKVSFSQAAIEQSSSLLATIISIGIKAFLKDEELEMAININDLEKEGSWAIPPKNIKEFYWKPGLISSDRFVIKGESEDGEEITRCLYGDGFKSKVADDILRLVAAFMPDTKNK